MNNHRLIQGDCLKVIENSNESWQCIFADPPDNIGLAYGHMIDNILESNYIEWLDTCFRAFIAKVHITWISYNAKWQFEVSRIVSVLLKEFPWLIAKQCVQTFTFGQHNRNDLGNSYRPLLRLMHRSAVLYPDQIRIQSERQKSGDKRADPRGRVPGDVFNFPRVTGNSRQRRKWHPTQLHEGLIERCIKMSTVVGEKVLDPFAGTETTFRVCRSIGRPCTLIENSEKYCKYLAKEHNLDTETV